MLRSRSTGSPSPISVQAASAAYGKRFSEAFSRVLSTHASRSAGTEKVGVKAGGRAWTWERIRSVSPPSGKTRLPQASSQAMQPTAYRSVQGPIREASRENCSGAMYWGVPAGLR